MRVTCLHLEHEWIAMRGWLMLLLIVPIAVGTMVTILPTLNNVTGSQETLVVASGTTLYDTGLLDHVNAAFQEKTGVTVKVLSLGTGQSLETARRGEADVVLVHSRPLEETFMKEGYGIHRVGVAVNDFLIVGPPEDPAHVASAENPRDAFLKIAQAGQRGEAIFISRGDRSGTHIKELELWSRANVQPNRPWYLEANAGMGNTLLVAAEKRAYALTDKGTYTAFEQRLNLRVFIEGGEELLNPYAAILVNPEKFPHTQQRLAVAYVKFLVSEEGQRLIAAYEKNDVTLFRPSARDFNTANELGFPDQQREIGYFDSVE